MKAKIWNYSGWITDTNPEAIRSFFQQVLVDSGFNVLCCVDHYFQPFGYTALYLLSESHFAVHTFPEENKSYIELSSCNGRYFDNFVSRVQHKVIK